MMIKLFFTVTIFFCFSSCIMSSHYYPNPDNNVKNITNVDNLCLFKFGSRKYEMAVSTEIFNVDDFLFINLKQSQADYTNTTTGEKFLYVYDSKTQLLFYSRAGFSRMISGSNRGFYPNIKDFEELVILKPKNIDIANFLANLTKNPNLWMEYLSMAYKNKNGEKLKILCDKIVNTEPKSKFSYAGNSLTSRLIPMNNLLNLFEPTPSKKISSKLPHNISKEFIELGCLKEITKNFSNLRVKVQNNYKSIEYITKSDLIGTIVQIAKKIRELQTNKHNNELKKCISNNI